MKQAKNVDSVRKKQQQQWNYTDPAPFVTVKLKNDSLKKIFKIFDVEIETKYVISTFIYFIRIRQQERQQPIMSAYCGQNICFILEDLCSFNVVN